MNNNKNTSNQVIVLVGNMSEGYRAVGPYEDMEEAFEAHFGEEVWLMTLHSPAPLPEPIKVEKSQKPDNVANIFDYKNYSQPKDK